MEEPRRLAIKPDVQRLLFSRSGGRCAFPKCNKMLLDENDRLKGEICHIEAAMPGGERFNPFMTNEQRRSYENLILLCFDHHEETNNEEVYTVGVLKEMKKAYEKNVSTSLGLINSLLSVSNKEKATNSQINQGKIEQALFLLNKHEEFIDSKSGQYDEPANYINRSVYYINDSDGFWDRKKHDLIQLVKSKKRITILGIAGSGKSIELNYLAFHYSAANSSMLPIKIRLNSFTNNEGIKQLLSLEFPDFQKFKNQRLLVILDALDEVAPKHIGEAINQISNLDKELPQSTIVVSCRNNFYTVESDHQKSRISGFETYALNPLSSFDIEQYCNTMLGDNGSVFIDEVYKKRLYDQLKSPFYLVHLTEYFKKNGKLPNARQDIFEFLIDNRIQNDKQNKYQNTGLNIDEYQEEIKNHIERLAISSVSFGRNYLEDCEYRKLVSSPDLQRLIKYTFLFDRNKSGSWEFEHNNFQEYLAAKYLSEISFKEIKQFISFQPGLKKIKPTWVNTLSFLFSILFAKRTKFNRLLKWLISIEPDLIIRFEKDRIELKTREKIFKRIYSDFEQKKILIRSEKFYLEELADFISDSHKLAELMIRKAQKLTEPWKISEALRILPRFDIIKQYLPDIEKVILKLIKSDKIKDDYKLSFFYTLRELNIYSGDLTEEILKNIDLESSQYLRAGFYAYLSNAKDGDSYIDIILNGINYIIEPNLIRNPSSEDEEENRLSDEKYNLERLIEKFGSAEITKSLLQWGHNIDETRYDNFHIEILKQVLSNSIELTINCPENELYDAVLSLLISLARKYTRELSKEFSEFFSKTNTSLKAFHELRNQSKQLGDDKIDFDYALGAVADKKCVDVMLVEYKNGELSKEMAFRYRNIFALSRRDLHDHYLKEINNLSDNAFAYSERNYEQERLDKLQNDISLLLDRQMFRSKLLEIFNIAGVDSFKKKEIRDLFKKYPNDENSSNNIVLSTLREEARDLGIVNRDSIINRIDDDESWYWFQIHEILQIDKNNEDFDFKKNGKKFLKEWLVDAIEKADFKTSVYRNQHHEIRYRYLEHFIPYISHRIQYALDDEIYLDFFYLIPRIIPQKIEKNTGENIHRREDRENDLTPANLNKYVVDKIGLEKSCQRINYNIETNALVNFQQKFNHCKFCFDYGLDQGVNLIKEMIEYSKHQYEKRELITWYLNLSNETTFIETQIDSFEEELRFHAIEKLLVAGSEFAAEYCHKKVNSVSDREKKFSYINLLFKANPYLAFKLYKEWIITNKQIPDRVYRLNDLRSEQIDDYIDIYEDALKYDYGKGTWNNKDEFIGLMIELGARDAGSFKKVKQKFEYWIKNYGLKSLYYQIQKLELEYYSRVSQTISIDEVIDLLDNPKADGISWLNGILDLRPNIAGIGLNLNAMVDYLRKRKS